jgi:succinyl-CoA synthetase beta subunit
MSGMAVTTSTEALEAARSIGGNVWVIKAQIHAGGRGKAGGVKLVHSPEEAKEVASKMLGSRLVTPQTSAEGKLVRFAYVEAGCQAEKEYYLSFLIDRAHHGISIIASTEGGVNIEETAHTHPDAICKVQVDILIGVLGYQIRALAQHLKLHPDQLAEFTKLIHNTYKLFTEKDLSLLEINPLVSTTHGDLIALDAKMIIDNNALYRHRDLKILRDLDEEDPTEVQASQYDLNYIKLNGNIGCMVNGAGLAMATMDIIKLYGEEPANFLDVGGSATKERVIEAFKIIEMDPHVKAILVNIFGGIVKCDLIAQGILDAIQEIGLKVPVVVRLEGTHSEEGQKILKLSRLNIVTAHSLEDAAKKVTNITKGKA